MFAKQRTCALLFSAVVVSFLGSAILHAQSAPTLKPAFAGAIAVTGYVARGVHAVYVYDLRTDAETKIGSGTSVDVNGRFVVVVKPPLKTGQQIVAVDSFGARSNVIVVAAPPKGPHVSPAARP